MPLFCAGAGGSVMVSSPRFPEDEMKLGATLLPLIFAVSLRHCFPLSWRVRESDQVVLLKKKTASTNGLLNRKMSFPCAAQAVPINFPVPEKYHMMGWLAVKGWLEERNYD